MFNKKAETMNQMTPPDAKTVDQPKPLWLRSRLWLGGIVAALLFFGLTSPKSVPSVLLIAGFVMLAVLLYSLMRLILTITGLQASLPATYRRGLMLATTILPVLLLALQSIGQLTVRDVLTLCGLFAIGIFYISRINR